MPIDEEASALFQFDLILMNFSPSQIESEEEKKSIESLRQFNRKNVARQKAINNRQLRENAISNWKKSKREELAWYAKS